MWTERRLAMDIARHVCQEVAGTEPWAYSEGGAETGGTRQITSPAAMINGRTVTVTITQFNPTSSFSPVRVHVSDGRISTHYNSPWPCAWPNRIMQVTFRQKRRAHLRELRTLTSPNH